jgi:TIR domain-containing protein
MRQGTRPSARQWRARCITVFLSYAHRDEKLREELGKHLSSLQRSAIIESWCDRRIAPGADVDCEIARHLRTSDLVLLLISPDFMNSDYCYRREMRVALKRHARGEARVIPIILRPVDWLRTPIGKLLALPRDAKPVTSWHRRDEALLDVAKGVRRAVEEMGPGRSRPPAGSGTRGPKRKRDKAGKKP